MAAKFWSNVQVAIQSALAAADTITAITNANPGVATSTAHGLVDGDFIFLTVNGMAALNERVVRVDGATANTFELENVDTTLLGTFSSGSAQAVTYGINMTTVIAINSSGGEPEFADITTIHDNVRKQVPVVTSGMTITMDSLFDAADQALIALAAAADALGKRAIRLTFADGGKIVFAGYVSASLIPTGSAQEVVKTGVTLTAAGRRTVYAA